MSDNAVIIREATTGDIDSLAMLITELGYPTTTEEMAVRFSALQKNEQYKSFVVEAQNKVVGMAGATWAPFYERNGTYVRLVALVTSNDQRNKGIGKALVEAVEQWAKHIGASAVVLNCGNRPERDKAHSFYKSIGYAAKSTGYSKEL